MEAVMEGKTCLITGATAGIGKETARGLARMGARVLLHGRNPVKLTDTAYWIREETGNDSIETIRADFSSLRQVNAMADEIVDRFKRLDVLINNAGATFPRKQLSDDGYEKTFAVNHLAPFLLTNRLLPVLKASVPARIINISSMIHAYMGANFHHPGGRPYLFFVAYGRSKLANMLFTYELARQLDGSGVTVNAVHPGVIRSKIYVTGFKPLDTAIKALLGSVLTPEEGAETPIYLASADEVEGISGKYFIDRTEAKPGRRAANPDLARYLWKMSLEMVESALEEGSDE